MTNIVSLFTGAGGLDLAFQATRSCRTRFSIDVQPEYCETIKTNQASGVFGDRWDPQVGDVRKVRMTDVVPKSVRRGVWGVVGGPPCESFSSMGLRGGHSDPRGTLVFTFAKAVAEARADFFLMENVPALADADDGRPFLKLLDTFRASGFDVAHRVLMAADYGAPTMRKRLFVVGMRGAKFEFPAASHGKSAAAGWATVRHALDGLPAPSTAAPGVPQAHVLVKHSDVVRERFASVKPGSYDNVRKRSRLHWERPSPSLVAGDLRGIRSHIHPEEPRELTNRESARIQGFSDEFVFCGSTAAVGKQIANAVPLALGTAVARALVAQVS